MAMAAVPVDSMAVGVFGRLEANELIYASDPDCYSAFRAISSIMGVLSAADTGGSHGLWGMNDAGGPWLGDDPAGRRAHVQVHPDHDRDAPLPIEPFIVAAVATVERFGLLELHGLELYLPISMAGPADPRISDGQAWFAMTDPRTLIPLRVTLDSGDSPAVVDHRTDLVAALADIGPPDELLRAELLDDDAVDFADPVPWRWWLGDGDAHTVTFSTSATEWTPLAIGRVVSFLSEACRRIGLTDHVGVRVVRDDH